MANCKSRDVREFFLHQMDMVKDISDVFVGRVHIGPRTVAQAVPHCDGRTSLTVHDGVLHRIYLTVIVAVS